LGYYAVSSGNFLPTFRNNGPGEGAAMYHAPET
jgi:hypothetical protein